MFMIHLSERLRLQQEYEGYIEIESNKIENSGYIIRKDSIINFVFFLLERGILDEYDIHDYFKRK